MCTVHEFIKHQLILPWTNQKAGLANPVSIKGTISIPDYRGAD